MVEKWNFDELLVPEEDMRFGLDGVRRIVKTIVTALEAETARQRDMASQWQKKFEDERDARLDAMAKLEALQARPLAEIKFVSQRFIAEWVIRMQQKANDYKMHNSALVFAPNDYADGIMCAVAELLKDEEALSKLAEDLEGIG